MNESIIPEKYFKPFNYIEELDAFIINTDFDIIADYLGIKEWHAAVWLGRFFTLDADVGEHWFDNWNLREKKEIQAKQMGIDSYDLLIIDPHRFKMNDYRGDGPCHSDQQIKLFWTDILKTMKISLNLMIEEARRNKKELESLEMLDAEEYRGDLEERIQQLIHRFT